MVRALLTGLLAAAALAGGLGAQQPAEKPFLVDRPVHHLALVDLDGDRRKEVLEVHGALLVLTTPAGEELTVTIPGDASVWTIADLDGDGEREFLILEDGEALRRLQWSEGALSVSPPLLEGLGGSLPRGVRTASFARDLDGDGRADLVVPDGGRLRLYFGSAEGFEPGPDLGMVSRLSLRTSGRSERTEERLHGRPRNLMERVSRELFIPRITMRDLNGDGRPDLQVSEPTEIRQYIAGPGGLPAEPSVTINLKEFEAKLPEVRFDPSNIAGLAKYAVFEEWADLNRDGAQDLIILWGGVVLIYMGGPDGIDLRRPFDQLPTRGNVFYAFGTDVNADELPDLLLLRVEDISLGKALSSILLSFSLQLDILAYEGKGNGRFERRPMPQSKSLKIDSPSLKSLWDQKSQGDGLRRTVVRLADFDGDGDRTDLVVLDAQGRLLAWQGLVTDPTILDQVTEIFLARLLRGDEVVELDVETLTGWLLGRSSLLLSLTEGKAPLFELAPDPGWDVPHAMTTLDMDGDGGDEILMLRHVPIPPQGDRPASSKLVGKVVDPGDDAGQ